MGRATRPERTVRRVGRVLRGRQTAPDGFAAFLSYSRHDEALASALHTGIERFATPWYLPRRVRIFRDDAVLPASSALWRSLSDALAHSAHLIVLASPPAAESVWVNDEIRWWRENRSTDTVVLVLADGEAEWDGSDFDPARSSAIPGALRGVFSEEPRWVDLRAARHLGTVDQADPRWADGVADVAAAVQDVSKDSLVGEHVRERRRTTRWVRTTTLTLVLLLLLAVAGAVVAWQQRDQALDQTRHAEASLALARADQVRPTDPSLAARLTAVAYAIDPGPETAGAVVAAQGVPMSREIPAMQAEVSRVAGVGSPDGGRLAATPDGLVVRASYRGVQIDDLPVARSTFVPDLGSSKVAVDPSGKLLAATVESGVGLFLLRGADQPQRVGPVLPTRGIVQAVALDQSGTRVAVADADGLHLWGVGDPQRPVAKPAVYPRDDPTALPVPLAVAFSPDGRTIATGSDEGVRLWSPRPDGRPAPLGGPLTGTAPERSPLLPAATSATGRVGAVAFSPDGRFLASGGIDATIRLWLTVAPDHATEVGAPLRGHDGEVTALSFDARSAPRAPTLYSGSVDRTLLRWDIGPRAADVGVDVTPTGPPFVGHQHAVEAIAVTDDAVVSVDDGSAVRAWPVDRRRAAQVGSVRFAADGRALIGVGGGQVTVDSVAPDASLGPPVVVRLADHADVAASRALLAAASPSAPGGEGARPIELVDVGSTSGPVIGTIPTTLSDASVTLDPTGRIAVLQGRSPGPGVEAWDVSNPPSPRLLWSGTTRAGRLVFDARGSRMASSVFAPTGAPSDTAVWTDPRSPSPTASVPRSTGGVGSPGAIAMSPDGRVLVLADQVADGRGGTAARLTFWDVGTTSPFPLAQLLTGQRGSVGALAFSPAADRLAAGADDGTVRLISTEGTPAPVGPPLDDASGAIRSVEFSPDGTVMAAGSDTLRLWRLSAADVVDDICATAGPTIDPADWARNLPSLDYRPVC